MIFESEHHENSNRDRSMASIQGLSNNDNNAISRLNSDRSVSSKGKEKDHRPIIAPGELREMVNKRSESANRKYRAYRNFIKYHNNNNK